MTAQSAALGVLAHRNFTLYLVARFIATLAVQMQSVAIGWQVYAITNDPLDLGLIGLAQFLPFIVLVLPAGQIADRFDRRLILAACYLVDVVCAALLLGFTIAGLDRWTMSLAVSLLGAACWWPPHPTPSPTRKTRIGRRIGRAYRVAESHALRPETLREAATATGRCRGCARSGGRFRPRDGSRRDHARD